MKRESMTRQPKCTGRVGILASSAGVPEVLTNIIFPSPKKSPLHEFDVGEGQQG